jgi:hypothetical protein
MPNKKQTNPRRPKRDRILANPGGPNLIGAMTIPIWQSGRAQVIGVSPLSGWLEPRRPFRSNQRTADISRVVTERIAHNYFHPHDVKEHKLCELGRRSARSQLGMRHVTNGCRHHDFTINPSCTASSLSQMTGCTCSFTHSLPICFGRQSNFPLPTGSRQLFVIVTVLELSTVKNLFRSQWRKVHILK